MTWWVYKSLVMSLHRVLCIWPQGAKVSLAVVLFLTSEQLPLASHTNTITHWPAVKKMGFIII